jgi:Fungal specific transcription factor domain
LILSATIPLAPQTSPHTIVSQAFTLAALLYLHLTFRLLPSFPNPSKLHLRLVSKILRLVSTLSPSQFSSPESLDLFLWVVFICSAAFGSGYLHHQPQQGKTEMEEEIGVQAQDFVVLMRRVHPEIVGQSKAQVRQRLRSIVWRDGVCDILHDGIWRVVESMRAGNFARV